MSVTQSSHLADRVRLAERPPARVRMPPASLAERLKTTMWIRRLLPTAVVVDRAARKGRLLWPRSAWWREDARAAMMPVIAGTSWGRRLEDVARAYLVEREACSALFWQPWRPALVDERSLHRFERALADERGVLLSACHLGPYTQISAVLADLGCTPYGIVGAWFLERPSHDIWGRRLARWHNGLAGARLVSAKGSFAVVRELLARGRCVVLFFDMPGHRQTRFLGKQAMLADGTARLAIDGDALVLPIRLRRRGHRVCLDVADALDPREHADADELHEVLARLHERWILEFPAAMSDPRSFGWEQAARADGWALPERAAG
jgi:lauroyl/myristoyl acyltransferase